MITQSLKSKIIFLIFSVSVFLSSCGNVTSWGFDENPDTGDLPEFRLYLSEEELGTLYDSLGLNVEASCRYESDLSDMPYGEGRINIRGFTSLMMPKKSFTLTVDNAEGEAKYALDAQGDPWIGYGLVMYAYSLAGLPAAQLDPVALFLNDEYLGLYSRIYLYDGNIDEYYRESGDLYKIKVYDMGYDIPLQGDSEKKYPDDEDFTTLNRLLANAAQMPSEEWVQWVESHVDLESVADYMVIRDYFGMADTYNTNFYIYAGDRYRIIPWDNDHYFDMDSPVGGNNLITRRMLESGEFREEYREKFNSYFLDETDPDSLLPALRTYGDELAVLIDAAALSDPVFYLEYEDFLAEQMDISDFFDTRADRILEDQDWQDFFENDSTEEED